MNTTGRRPEHLHEGRGAPLLLLLQVCLVYKADHGVELHPKRHRARSGVLLPRTLLERSATSRQVHEARGYWPDEGKAAERGQLRKEGR